MRSGIAAQPIFKLRLGLSVLLINLFVVASGTLASAGPCDLADGTHRVYVRDFHAAGDGKTDDGPAIRAALQSALSGPKPASVEFDGGKTYRIASFDDTYALQLLNAQQVTLRGNGAELLLLPPNKTMRIDNSSGINVCGFTIDYSPLPFTQGLVVATDPAAGTFDLEIEKGFDVPAADDNSVTDNNKVWRFAMPYKPGGKHERRVQIFAVYATEKSRQIRIKLDRPQAVERLRPGRTHLVMAMPGMGQTGNFTFRITHNKNVHLESIKIYSVPRFTFFIGDNFGPISLANVEQRRRPGSDRVMTGWRDVFHIKNNRAPVTWDGCYVEGAFDDAFNLSAIYQRVVEKLGDNRWRLRDVSAAGIAPIFKPGDRLQAIDLIPERKLLGETRIETVTQHGGDSVVTVSPPLPLKAYSEHCERGDDACGSRVIDLDAANEGSVIKGCTVLGSIRLRSKTTVEKMKLTGLLRITGDPIRGGPLPDGIVIKDSDLSGRIRIGADRSRRSKYDVLWSSGERWARNIVFQNDRIAADFVAGGASFSLIGDDLIWPRRRQFRLRNSGPIHVKDLKVNGVPVDDPTSRLRIGPNMTRQDIVIDAK